MKEISKDQQMVEAVEHRLKTYSDCYNTDHPQSTLMISRLILKDVLSILNDKTSKPKAEKKISGRFFAPITKDELAKKILDAFCTNQYYSEKEYAQWLEDRGCIGEIFNPIKMVEDNAHDLYPKQLTKQIEKDLSKVEFDTENLTCDCKESFGYGRLVGFNTLSNGLTHLGIACGGDWESSLFWIIYYDGTQLRAYIPTEGNTWNTDNKKAYGNGETENEDDDNALKRFSVESCEQAEPDPKKIIEDIIKRIKPK